MCLQTQLVAESRQSMLPHCDWSQYYGSSSFFFFAEGEEAVRTLQFADALSIFIYLAIEKCYSMVRRMRSATSQSSIFTFSPFSVMVKD